MREKVEERILFLPEKKKEILAKSNGMCAHCGKPQKIKTVTIDHVIPLGKGGTNDDDNLVALCLSCNSKKDDDIIDPEVYYKYLKPEYKKELKSNHKAYCDDISWLTPKQYTKEDKIMVRYASRSSITCDHFQKSGDYLKTSGVIKKAVLSKAKYSDLEEVEKYLKKYHKKFNLETSDLKDSISGNFAKGCIYQLKRENEIIALFPVSIQKGGLGAYHLVYSGLPILYQREDYIELICRCIETINEGLYRACGKNFVVYEISHPSNDEYAKDVIKNLRRFYSGYYCKLESDDEKWDEFLFIHGAEDVKYDSENTEKTTDWYIQYFSQSIERIMRLAPINKHQPVERYQPHKKNKSLARERRQMSREIDEYDERYYQCN